MLSQGMGWVGRDLKPHPLPFLEGFPNQTHIFLLPALPSFPQISWESAPGSASRAFSNDGIFQQ